MSGLWPRGVGESRGDGAYSQDGPAYLENCAYYATDNITSLQQHLGVTVIDASDPKNPQPTAYLNDNLISSDEDGGSGGAGGWPAACARGASPFGYPQIIDIGDETNPKIVARLRLEIDLPANCSALLAETPPDTPNLAPGFSEERCVPNRLNDATMMACSRQSAGLRVYDIRDPLHAREIAYWKPRAVRTEVRPGSGSWVQAADATVDRLAGWARWVVAEKGNGNGADLNVQLWTVSDANGFQILHFSQDFVAKNEDLFKQ